MQPSKFSPKLSDAGWSGERWEVVLLIVNLAWTTLCLGGFLAETMVVSSALTGLLGLVHLWRQRASDYGAHPAGWWLGPFLLYAAVNVAVITPVRWLGWMDWLGWAQPALIFWCVLNGVRSRRAQSALLGSLVALAAVLVVLAAYQRFVAPEWLILGRTQAGQFVGRASGSFGMPNSFAAFLILILPIPMAWAWEKKATAVRRVIGIYFAAVLSFGLVLTISRGAWIALALASGLWPLMVSSGSWVRKALSVAITWFAIAAVAGVIVATVPAVRDRVQRLESQRGELSRPIMWKAAWRLYRAAPLVGSGAGSYGVSFERYRPEDFQLEPRWAHNEYLNTLSDYGTIGGVLALAAVAGICGGVVRARDRTADPGHGGPALTAALLVGTTAFLLQMCVDFSLKIPALAMSFAVIAALLIQRTWPVPASVSRSNRLRRLILGLIAAGLVAAMIFAVVPLYRGEALRQQVRRDTDRLARNPALGNAAKVSAAAASLARATERSPSNAQAWADRSMITAALIRFEPSRTLELAAEAERYANAALLNSEEVSDFWVRRGVALDAQGQWISAGSAFVRALTLAPAKAAVWYPYALHLSFNPAELSRALAAVDFCLRLDPGNGPAHALRERLAERSQVP